MNLLGRVGNVGINGYYIMYYFDTYVSINRYGSWRMWGWKWPREWWVVGGVKW